MQETCYQYWPVRRGMAQFREYTVDLMEEKPVKGFVMRTLVVVNEKVTLPTSLFSNYFSLCATGWQCPPGGSVAHD